MSESDVRRTILEHLNDPESSWSIGSLGAVGEFWQDAGERLFISPTLDSLCIATARGALRIDLPDGLEPFAYETLRAHRDRWNQTLAFCLPLESAMRSRRGLLTELGEDHDSVLPEHRGDILFDLGLGLTHIDACVRTKDAELISSLRQACGSNILEDSNPIMFELIQASPHRIFASQCGRAEIYQAIGTDQCPIGPHTHVLPKLLATGRTHSAQTPLPPDRCPV